MSWNDGGSVGGLRERGVCLGGGGLRQTLGKSDNF